MKIFQARAQKFPRIPTQPETCKNKRWSERDNRIKGGILDVAWRFISFLAELYRAGLITWLFHSAPHT